MTIQIPIRSSLLLASAIALFFSVGMAQAQEAELIDESRDEAQLRVEVREAIERDTDVANTALVFNNASRGTAFVHCTAYDGNGNVLGGKVARIPAQGLRYLRASDLSDGVDFVGSVLCKARGHIAASAVFLAPGAVTSLDVITAEARRSTRIRFPLVASY